MTTAISAADVCPNCRRTRGQHRPWCARFKTIPEPPKSGETVDDPVFGATQIISVYSRQMAIDDGELVDCTAEPFDELNRNAGVIFDVAMTRTAFERYVEVPPDFNGTQDIDGRYWDVVTMFRHAARKRPASDALLFEFISIPNGSGCLPNERQMRGSPQVTVQLKAVSHPGDRMEPCITFMFPDED